jgi:hypothetical protein
MTTPIDNEPLSFTAEQIESLEKMQEHVNEWRASEAWTEAFRPFLEWEVARLNDRIFGGELDELEYKVETRVRAAILKFLGHVDGCEKRVDVWQKKSAEMAKESWE